MRRSIANATAFLLATTLLAAQLPPDVQVDRLWLRAERQIDNEEYWSGLASLEEILELQAEHDLAIPESFWFSHAVASHHAGLHTQAAASATRYVELTGRDGEHYLEALELLDTAEAAAEREAAEARRLAARLDQEEREAEARRAAQQAVINAQAEATAEREEEMTQVAAELARLAPEMDMVVIPAGSFRMGCITGLDCSDPTLPVHDVAISRPFAVSKHEVTFAQWDACVAAGGCLDHQGEGRRQRRRGYRPDDEGWGRGNRPVINVSWQDAKNYVRWFTESTGATYRLLSEAEWEYAARAGSSTVFSWGNEIDSSRANYWPTECDNDGWCSRAPEHAARGQTVPVGSFAPNAWGLYDMHGNVEEWVEDCWNDDYTGAPADGSAWLSGDCDGDSPWEGPVIRDGSWEGWGVPDGWAVRIASRYPFSPDYRGLDSVGFRIARTLGP